jgi:hypothetical protein
MNQINRICLQRFTNQTLPSPATKVRTRAKFNVCVPCQQIEGFERSLSIVTCTNLCEGEDLLTRMPNIEAFF